MSSEEGTIIKSEIKKLPRLTGVYIMKDSNGKIIYVGKAKNINKRVRSYFNRKPDSPKTEALVRRVKHLEYVTTESEVEALILECNLIKENRPAYNVRLKDDKKYPYIKLTAGESFPRLILVRNIRNDGSEYFGPYTDVGAVRRTLAIIAEIFPLRRCSNARFHSSTGRECLYFQLAKCSAPCTGRIKKEEYKEMVSRVKLFLSGKSDRLMRILEKRMKEFSSSRRYEKAALIRDQIRAIKKISEKQIAFEPGGGNQDFVALAREKERYCAVLMKVREGRILSSETFLLPYSAGKDRAEMSDSFIKLYYHSASDIPGVIYLQDELFEEDLITRWLGEKTGRRIVFRVPRRGKKKRLMEMARRNALLKLLQSWSVRGDEMKVLDDVKKVLRLKSTPLRVEGYDISNIQGFEAVGSMVAFRNGKPDKSGYRHFRIRTVKGSDDFAMISEVVSRRFRNIGGSKVPLPDMVLIDGGKGQVNAAAQALKEKGIQDIPVIGLAKRNEEIHILGEKNPVKLPRNSEALKFLQRVRDESHRFAVRYHRNIRSRRSHRSRLDEIPGIGEARKMLLMIEFGSVERISRSTEEEIASIPGIGGKLARKILQYLKEESS